MIPSVNLVTTAGLTFSGKRQRQKGKAAASKPSKPNVKPALPVPVEAKAMLTSAPSSGTVTGGLSSGNASPRQWFLPLTLNHIASIRVAGEDALPALKGDPRMALTHNPGWGMVLSPADGLRQELLRFTSPTAPEGPGHVLVDATGLLHQLGHEGVMGLMKQVMRGRYGGPAGTRCYVHNALHQHLDRKKVPQTAYREFQEQIRRTKDVLALSFDGQTDDPRYAAVRAVEETDQRLGQQYPADELFAIGWLGGVSPEEPRGIAIRRRPEGIGGCSPAIPLLHYTDGAETPNTLFARFLIANNTAYAHGNVPKSELLSEGAYVSPPIVSNPHDGLFVLRDDAQRAAVTAGMLARTVDDTRTMGPEARAMSYFKASPLERSKQAIVFEP